MSPRVSRLLNHGHFSIRWVPYLYDAGVPNKVCYQAPVILFFPESRVGSVTGSRLEKDNNPVAAGEDGQRGERMKLCIESSSLTARGINLSFPIEPTVHEKYASDDLLLALDDIAADKQCFRAGGTGLVRVCPSFHMGKIAADFSCLISRCFDCPLICCYSAG